MLKSTSGKATDYARITTSGGAVNGLKFFGKALLVSCDEHGVVSEVEFSTSGSK